MKTKLLNGFILLLTLYLCCFCSKDYKNHNINILFHGQLGNNTRVYNSIKYLCDSLKNETPYVSLIHCGNFSNSNPIGKISRGESIIDIMNITGYNIVSLGHNDFDYGIDQLDRLVSKLNAKTVCCNFSTINNNKRVYKGYILCEYGEKKIAFIGIANPTVLQTHPKYMFMDKNGNIAYNFNENDLPELLQKTVNHARLRGADFVILLSDMEDHSNDSTTICQIIKNTHGIDVLLLYNTKTYPLVTHLSNNKQKNVILASNNYNGNHIGKLTITENGTCQISFLSIDSIKQSEKSAQKIANILKKNNIKMEEFIGINKVQFASTSNHTVNNPSLLFYTFIANAFREEIKSDIAIISSTNFQNKLDTGTIRYKDLYSLFTNNFPLMKCEIQGGDLQKKISTLSKNNVSQQQNAETLFISGIKLDSPLIQIWHKNTWTTIDTNRKYTLVTCDKAYSIYPQFYHNIKSVRNINKDNTQLLIDYISKLGDSITLNPTFSNSPALLFYKHDKSHLPQ